MTPAQAHEVLETCRVPVFIAQSFAVRGDRLAFDGSDDTDQARDALDEVYALLPIADPTANEDLHLGCAALMEATELGQENLHGRQRRHFASLTKRGVEHLSLALARLSDLADLAA